MGYTTISLAVLNAAPQKDCGSCTACCDVIGVTELGKPFYARCKHLGEGGCTIYGSHPVSCQKYRCAWHQGFLGDSIDRRPDKCGILIDIIADRNGQISFEVFEAEVGAFAAGRQLFLTQKLRSHKKFKDVQLYEPAVRLFPYGAKVHLSHEVSTDYEWTPPAGNKILTCVGISGDPDEVTFRGEIAPLSMPNSLRT